jgi:hypothetical protein
MRLSIFASLSMSIVLVACSSSNPDPPGAPAAQDSGSTSSPPPSADPTPFTPITLTVTGNGRVVTKDSAVDCKSDGTTQSGQCTIAAGGDVLYASHGYNWSFDHWEPSMQKNSTLLVPTTNPPATIVAVFEYLGGSAEPSDAGAD